MTLVVGAAREIKLPVKSAESKANTRPIKTGAEGTGTVMRFI
jgi:hypothetical protein